MKRLYYACMARTRAGETNEIRVLVDLAESEEAMIGKIVSASEIEFPSAKGYVTAGNIFVHQIDDAIVIAAYNEIQNPTK